MRRALVEAERQEEVSNSRVKVVCGRGRPRFAPTNEQRRNVEILVGLGIPQAHICRIVRDHKGRPISENTLRKYFKQEIAGGAAKVHALVGQFLIATALGTAPPPGVQPITDPKVRGAFTELFARARMGWHTTGRTLIRTVSGRGYQFTAEIRNLSEDPNTFRSRFPS